jgi:hypothetical protein
MYFEPFWPSLKSLKKVLVRAKKFLTEYQKTYNAKKVYLL